MFVEYMGSNIRAIQSKTTNRKQKKTILPIANPPSAPLVSLGLSLGKELLNLLVTHEQFCFENGLEASF